MLLIFDDVRRLYEVIIEKQSIHTTKVQLENTKRSHYISSVLLFCFVGGGHVCFDF